MLLGNIGINHWLTVFTLILNTVYQKTLYITNSSVYLHFRLLQYISSLLHNDFFLSWAFKWIYHSGSMFHKTKQTGRNMSVLLFESNV